MAGMQDLWGMGSPPGAGADTSAGILGWPARPPGADELTAALKAQAGLEGRRYWARMSNEQPHTQTTTSNIFGASLTYQEPVPGVPTDYWGMLMNEGVALGNQNALGDYARMQDDARETARGMPLSHWGPTPPTLSPNEEYALARQHSDTLRDTILGVAPPTAAAYGAWNAADLARGIPAQAQAGDWRGLGTSAVGTALGAAGLLPGGGMGARYAAEAARPGTATELGIFAGPKAATADKGALLTAMGMKAGGQSRDKIWAETGWFHDPADQKWKFEIPDNEADFSNTTRVNGVTYARGFEHPGLEAAYGDQPGQPAMGAMWGPGIGTQGGYLPPAGKPGEPHYAAPRIAVQAPDPETARLAALHEWQHDVQHREGFATGGSPAQFPDAQNAFAAYRNLPGEREARNVHTRADMTPEQRRATPPWVTADPFEGVPVPRQNTAGPSAALPSVPFWKENHGQYVQAALGDHAAITGETSPAAYQDHLQSLIKNKVIDPGERDYYSKLNQYAFRPSVHSEYANNIMQAYMNKSGGQIGKPIPISDLFDGYKAEVSRRDALGAQKTGGNEFYAKDLDALNRHLHIFGRRVGETFDETPSKPAPWLIDPKAGTVTFSPYIPEHPMIKALKGTQ